MTDPMLHYVFDPLCGWCYAAAPMVDAARAAGLPPLLHGGGLWPVPTRLPPAKAAYIRAADARIAEMTGQPFGAPYLDGLLADPTTVFWSRPTTAAVLAAGRLRAGADVDMLHAIQRAHYVDGRRVVDADVLADLAGAVGLDLDAFTEAIDAEDADSHAAATRILMDRTGARGFPTFLVETAGGMKRVPHERFYARPATFVTAVADAARHGSP